MLLFFKVHLVIIMGFEPDICVYSSVCGLINESGKHNHQISAPKHISIIPSFASSSPTRTCHVAHSSPTSHS